MNNLQESIPLFRTLATVPVATEAAKLPAQAPVATIGDLCGYVGQDVDGATWAALQAECRRRHGDTWRFDAEQRGDGWHITHLHARPGDVGAIGFLELIHPTWRKEVRVQNER